MPHAIGKSLAVLCLLSLLSPAGIQAGGLTLVSPLDYQVVQRTTKGAGKMPVSGRLTGAALTGWRIEARIFKGSKPGGWVALASASEAGDFSASLEAPAGGWYRVEVRAMPPDGRQEVAQAAVDRVGVGEVFVVAGQSNSANHGSEKQVGKTGQVTAFDGTAWRISHDPQPGASGDGGSFIPPLGDALAEKFQVPVGFICCGVGATSVRHWLPKGTRSPRLPTNESSALPDGEWESGGGLYDNLVSRMKALGPRGFRAVLWHQGESDANQSDPARTLPGPLYRDYLEKVIRGSRRDTGWEAPWFVAQVSYHVPGDEASPDIRAAQASLWKVGIALEGPDTDQLKSPWREADGQGVHFSGPGLREHAVRWAQKLSPWLEAQP